MKRARDLAVLALLLGLAPATVRAQASQFTSMGFGSAKGGGAPTFPLLSPTLGSASNVIYGNATSVNTGLWFPASTQLALAVNGTNALSCSSATSCTLGSAATWGIGGTGGGFSWATTGGAFYNDAAASFSTAAAGTANALHGTTLFVLAKTSNYSVSYLDNRDALTNTGAGGAVIFTLPTAVAGYEFTFVVTAAQTLEILAQSSNQIRVLGTLSATNGNTQAATVGNTIRLVAVSSSLWVAIAVNGTWTTT